MFGVPVQLLGSTFSRLPPSTGKFCVCGASRRVLMFFVTSAVIPMSLTPSRHQPGPSTPVAFDFTHSRLRASKVHVWSLAATWIVSRPSRLHASKPHAVSPAGEPHPYPCRVTPATHGNLTRDPCLWVRVSLWTPAGRPVSNIKICNRGCTWCGW